MTTTRETLLRIDSNLSESMGVRDRELRPVLSPVPSARDVGRRPIRNVGRVDVGNVMPDPDQPRLEFDESALARLAQSIRDKGQMSPIRVRWSSELNKWIIISGERRWRATRQAGLAEIECYFHEGELSRNEVLEQQLIENLLREDLSPLEEAKAYAQLIDMNNWNYKQLSEALRIDASKVTRAMALLKLPAEIQSQVAAGMVSARSAYEISRISDDAERQVLAAKVARGDFTHLDAAEIVRGSSKERKQRASGTRRVFDADSGWKVTVSFKGHGSVAEIKAALGWALSEVTKEER